MDNKELNFNELEINSSELTPNSANNKPYSFFNENTFNELLDEVESVYLNDKRPWIIGYSGGKDSSALLQITFKMLLRLPVEKRHKPVYVVSSDTLIENPVILDFLTDSMSKINQSANMNSLPIIAQIVYPDIKDSYWANIIGKGYVTPKSIQYRWCTDRLKIRPSNNFIKDKLKNQDVVVLLGVRKDESSARKARIEKREIEGYLLTPHGTLKGKNHLAYVYTPIVNFTTADVWDVLYHNNDDLLDFGDNFPSPSTAWGTSAMELFNMYMKGSGDSGECPFIADESTAKSSCGNSRFGCWICTVVKEDKSLNGFIDSGHDELIPLKDFRTWLLDERDKPENRRFYKRNGTVMIKDGEIKPGPFNFKARQKVLRKLLQTQIEVQKHLPHFELIRLDELKAIEQIWADEEDLTRSTLFEIYKEVVGEELHWKEYTKPILQDSDLATISNKCAEYNVNQELLNRLLIETNKHKHFSNKTQLKNSVSKLLNQQWLHSDITEKVNNNLKELAKLDINIT